MRTVGTGQRDDLHAQVPDLPGNGLGREGPARLLDLVEGQRNVAGARADADARLGVRHAKALAERRRLLAHDPVQFAGAAPHLCVFQDAAKKKNNPKISSTMLNPPPINP